MFGSLFVSRPSIHPIMLPSQGCSATELLGGGSGISASHHLHVANDWGVADIHHPEYPDW